MATIEDVALAAGVSHSTVSRVLNGRSTSIPISPETRERILAAAKDLSYRPNLFARSLKTKRSHILGVAIRDFTNPFWGGVIKGIIETATAHDYHAILSNIANEGEEEKAARTLLGELGVDGFLLVGDFPGDEGTIEQIIKSSPTTVALCRSLDPRVAPVIHVDDRRGFSMLMEHLYRLGHHQIGFIGLANPPGFADRHAAYREFLRDHGLIAPQALVDLTDVGRAFPSEDELVEIGATGARRIFDAGQPIQALACACDPIASGALRVARERGFSVPTDLSIAGFDDVPLARYSQPALTTIRQPALEMGQLATRLLIDLIEGKATRPAEAILAAPLLIVRESTAPPSHAPPLRSSG